MGIRVERDPDEDRLEALEMGGWSPWNKPESRFDWSYSDTETCYVQKGQVTVKLSDGDEVTIQAGDLAQFDRGVSCTWEITEDLEKVFTFDDVELDPDEEIGS